ncbi:MAG: alanine--tRNA ligase, partial [bacterium]|nr:alanine--tRNA ligase [bacterium]
TSERGIASGVRRLEAVTGEVAFAEVRGLRHQLGTIEEDLGVPAERVPSEIGGLKGKLKDLERELAKLRMQLASGGSEPQDETEVDGIRVLARELPRTPRNELRAIADGLRDKLGSGVVVVGSRADGKVSLIVTVSKDLTDRLSAGRLVKSLAPVVGGSGGGRPDFAQAGGKEPEKLPQLLASVPEVLAQQLAAE